MKRPRALEKIGPPWPSKVHHLQPGEARDIWQYVEHLEMLNEHGQDLAAAVLEVAHASNSD
jgi:hypothetical protein